MKTLTNICGNWTPVETTPFVMTRMTVNLHRQTIWWILMIDYLGVCQERKSVILIDIHQLFQWDT